LIYGDNSDQLLLGSSGKNAGGVGGGCLYINATGNIRMEENSLISCNGNNAFGDNGSSGSGGSIKIVCNQLCNKGKIQCLGGDGYLDPCTHMPRVGYSGMGKIYIDSKVPISNTDLILITPFPCNLQPLMNKSSEIDQIEHRFLNDGPTNHEIYNVGTNNLIIQNNSIYFLDFNVEELEYDNLIIKPYSILTCRYGHTKAHLKIKVNNYLIIENHGQINLNGCYLDEKGKKNGKNLNINANKLIIFDKGSISCNGINSINKDEIGDGGKIVIESLLDNILSHEQITSSGGIHLGTGETGENGEIIISEMLVKKYD